MGQRGWSLILVFPSLLENLISQGGLALHFPQHPGCCFYLISAQAGSGGLVPAHGAMWWGKQKFMAQWPSLRGPGGGLGAWLRCSGSQ